MLKLVVGFVFDLNSGRLLLIKKKRPASQAGRLNGPGGKIGLGETPRLAVSREIEKQTGLDIDPSKWRLYCHLTDMDDTYAVDFFVTVGAIVEAQAGTDEALMIVDPSALPANVIDNLPWLISMARTASPVYACVTESRTTHLIE